MEKNNKLLIEAEEEQSNLFMRDDTKTTDHINSSIHYSIVAFDYPVS